MAKAVSTPKPLRIHQAIAAELGTAILSGEYQPGDSLEGEIAHSLRLGVSRTAYREAVRILIAKGLLECRPKAGTHVTARQRWNVLDPDLLAWMFSGNPDERFIHDLFELRGIIEPAAAALAAERRTPAHLAAIDDALFGMGAHGLAMKEGQEADRNFHHAILEGAGNEALASLSSSIGAAVQWTTYFKQQGNRKPRDSLADHAAVRDAIAAGDPKRAKAAMSELLEFAFKDMTTALV